MTFKNSILTLALFIVFINFASGQKMFTKTGLISFFSDTPMEKIEAHNKSSSCVLDLSNGKLEFATLIKGFQFEKALMQEHFNENYMESNKFPKATFKGQIDNYVTIDLSKDKEYTVKVSGDLTIHGVTKPVATSAKLKVKGGKISSEAKFEVKVEDYDIKIPSLVKDKIAKVVNVVVSANLESLKS